MIFNTKIKINKKKYSSVVNTKKKDYVSQKFRFLVKTLLAKLFNLILLNLQAHGKTGKFNYFVV